MRQLRRSSSDRVIGGVAGGVAQSLGLDPLFVRVVIAVLALFGGAGLALYLIGWLLLAEDNGRPSIGARAATRRSEPGAGRPLVSALVLAIVAVVTLGIMFGSWDGSVLVVLVIVGLLLWLDRRPERVQLAGARTMAMAGGGPQVGATATVGQPMANAPTVAMPVGGATAAGGSQVPPGQWVTPSGPPQQPWSPPAPRSVLFPVTLSLMLIALGVLGAVDGLGGSIDGGAYPALALAVVGAGLLVGAWRGRSRGLIFVGLILAAATAGAVAADRAEEFGRDRVDLTIRATTIADLPASVDYGVGTARYDLTDVDFTGVDATSNLSIGAGELLVIVPRDVDVTVKASVGLGDADLFNDESGGPSTERTVTDLGGDGVGGGTLDLTMDVGLGHLEVRRG